MDEPYGVLHEQAFVQAGAGQVAANTLAVARVDGADLQSFTRMVPTRARTMTINEKRTLRDVAGKIEIKVN